MKKILSIATVLVVSVALAAANGTKERAATANNAFGLTLFKTVSKTTDKGNKFLSPVSAYLALSMLYNGATQNGTPEQLRTRNELEHVLAVNGLTRDDLNAANADLQQSLTSNAKDFQLAIANSLWARQGFNLKEDFVNRVRGPYQATLTTLDFSLPTAANTINTWVSNATHEAIPTIVENPLDRDIRLFLINATYFEADWSVQFAANNTSMRPFKVPAGNATREVQVPMMNLSSNFRHFTDRAIEVIDLPYGSSQKVSMVVVKPAGGLTPGAFASSLTQQSWAALTQRLDASPVQKGVLNLPKLEFSYDELLNTTLQTMGMRQAFTDSAEFEDLTADNDVKVSKVLQKTYIRVNEKGTKAAAATAITVIRKTTSLPLPVGFTMTVDQPYFFAIRDRQTGALLFVGTINEPEGGKMPEKAPATR